MTAFMNQESINKSRSGIKEEYTEINILLQDGIDLSKEFGQRKEKDPPKRSCSSSVFSHLKNKTGTVNPRVN